MKAVVFAYHNVGARCLPVLLAHGVEVPLVVTHRDNQAENIWFDSVAAVAAQHGIPDIIVPDDPNSEEIVARVRALQPDFLFSFYYRHMLKPPLLSIPKHGALNMHGSLLPKYRGRVPVNWAVINGETETGATLHYMAEKPDAGDIVARQAVAILPDDTAFDVFNKVTAAACRRCSPAARRASRRIWRRGRISAGASRRTAASSGAGRRRACTIWCAASRRPTRARSANSTAGCCAC